MVDRLFWRAGFGPSQADRATWTGKRSASWSTCSSTRRAAARRPTTARRRSGAPKTPTRPIDPLASDTELELEWIDRMQRAANPLPDRLAFFWHRHWAISRDDGIPNPGPVPQPAPALRRLRPQPGRDVPRARERDDDEGHGDVAVPEHQPERQGQAERELRARVDGAVLPRPEGARTGRTNYSQTDVAELAKALTGWVCSTTRRRADPAYGTTTFTPSRFEMAVKTFLGRTIAAVTGSRPRPTPRPAGPDAVNLAVDAVLAHGNHAQFLIRKLWAEFIASPIPQATLDALIATYRASGFRSSR